jgi:hypothetical protein
VHISDITGGCKIKLIGTKKDSTDYDEDLVTITDTDYEGWLDIDIAYRDVYANLNTNGLSIVAGNITGTDCTFTIVDMTYGYRDTSSDRVVNDLKTTLVNLDNAINTIEAENIEKAIFLVSPNGSKYYLKIDNSGVISSASVIPNKILFIGNSLLFGFTHGGSNITGMAASIYTKDYAHKVVGKITELNPSFDFRAVAGTDWENATTIADQTTFITNNVIPAVYHPSDPSKDPDLVIIQLGDNINTPEKKAILFDGVVNFVSMIKSVSPSVRVAWVASWFNQSNVTDIRNGCKKTGAEFIDISDLNTVQNQSFVGATYIDGTGATMTITTQGEATHPGDSGMLAIANRISYTLGITDTETDID